MVKPTFGQNAGMMRLTKNIGGALAVCAMLLPSMGSADDAKEGASSPVVVELFTSQGCYSCPPADVIAGELAKRDGVLPLSFHVTYWDRLGWPDTLGLEEGTARQNEYARYLGSGRVYTPQMMVHGQIDVVGSQRARVEKALEIMRDNLPEGPAIDVQENRVSIEAGQSEPATVWLAAYDDVHEVKIDRGENAGKTLSYYNSVRELTELGSFDGSALALDLPIARFTDEGRAGVAILVQRKSDGAILSAANIVLPASG